MSRLRLAFPGRKRNCAAIRFRRIPGTALSYVYPPHRNRHAVDTERFRVRVPVAKLLIELVEPRGIEPLTS